jgi:hypothetical protein
MTRENIIRLAPLKYFKNKCCAGALQNVRGPVVVRAMGMEVVVARYR